MQFNDYQKQALQFRMNSAYDPNYPLLNLAGEVGELLSLEAKAIRDGMKADHKQNVIKEVGDILWMLAAICDDYGLTLDLVAAANLDKLESRKERNVLSGSGDNR